VFCKEVLRFSK